MQATKAYLIQNHYVWPPFDLKYLPLWALMQWLYFIMYLLLCFGRFTGHKCTWCKWLVGPALHAKSRVHPRNFHNPHLNICIKHHGTGRWAEAMFVCLAYDVAFWTEKTKSTFLQIFHFNLCHVLSNSCLYWTELPTNAKNLKYKSSFFSMFTCQ